MTAEIAVMNRRAVAFAADSAMTISTTGKTYNSADKIFEISHHNPIGLMLYNSLDYMGMPLDVIVKRFREADKDNVVSRLTNAPEVFFDYLAHEFEVLHEDEDSHVSALAEAIFQQMNQEFSSFIFPTLLRQRRTVGQYFMPPFVRSSKIISICCLV